MDKAPEEHAPLFRRLDNGMRLLVARRAGAERFTLTALVDAGASSDPAGRKGLAHFLEHMVCGHWKDILGLMPAKLEAAFHAGQLFIDAETQLDYTIYKYGFPAALLEDFAAFDAARWSGRLIEPDAMARSLPGILHELKNFAPSSPAGRLYRALYAMIYPAHPYGAYTFGESADIEGLAFADCREFFRSRYRPDCVVLVCVSPLDPQAAADALERAYGAVPRGDGEAARPPLPAFASPAARFEALTGPGGPEAQLLAAVPLPAMMKDARQSAVMQGLNEYLVRSLRRRSPQWHGFLPVMRGAGLWELLGAAPGKSCGELRAELLVELEKIAGTRRASAEISSLLSALPKLQARSWEDPFKLSESLGLYELLGPGWRGALEQRERSKSLRWPELRDFLAQHVRPDGVFMAGLEPAAGLRR